MQRFNFNWLAVLFAAATLFFTACQKEQTENLTEPTAVLKSASQNNYITFANDAAFYAAVAQVANFSPAERISWENQQNIVSMYTIFESIVDAELLLSDAALNADGSVQHSEAAKNNPSVLYEQVQDDGNFYDINIHNYAFSRVVNKNGLVKIGNKIYQHTYKYTKTLSEPNLNKIALLIEAEGSDAANGIEVIVANPFARFGSRSRSCVANDRRLRGILYEEFVQNAVPGSPNLAKTFYSTKSRSLQKRLFGAWYDNFRTDHTSGGSHFGNIVTGVFLGSGTVTMVDYSGAYNDASAGTTHTLQIALPRQVFTASNPYFQTDISGSNHPEITRSTFEFVVSSSSRSCGCTLP